MKLFIQDREAITLSITPGFFLAAKVDLLSPGTHSVNLLTESGYALDRWVKLSLYKGNCRALQPASSMKLSGLK